MILICVCVCLFQCRGGPDRGLHHPEHCAGEDAVRGRGGHLPDGEDAADAEARHGADGGKQTRRHRRHDNRPTCMTHAGTRSRKFKHRTV